MTQEVGSLAEEAAKLAAALADWAKDLPGDGQHHDEAPGAESVAASQAAQESPGPATCTCSVAPECKVCPICRGLQVVRTLTPEVRGQLAVAAASLMQAASTILSGQGHGPAPGSARHEDEAGEHISLDDEDWEDDQA